MTTSSTPYRSKWLFLTRRGGEQAIAHFSRVVFYAVCPWLLNSAAVGGCRKHIETFMGNNPRVFLLRTVRLGGYIFRYTACSSARFFPSYSVGYDPPCH